MKTNLRCCSRIGIVEKSGFHWEFYILFHSANDTRTTIVRYLYDSFLKLRGSLDGSKRILRISHGFLEIRKTELTCECLAKSWTFFDRTPYGTNVCYTIILPLPYAFHNVCNFVSSLPATDQRQEIVQQEKYVWCEYGITVLSKFATIVTFNDISTIVVLCQLLVRR